MTIEEKQQRRPLTEEQRALLSENVRRLKEFAALPKEERKAAQALARKKPRIADYAPERLKHPLIKRIA